MTLAALFAEAERLDLDLTVRRIADTIGPTKYQVVVLTNSRRFSAICEQLEDAAATVMGEVAKCAG